MEVIRSTFSGSCSCRTILDTAHAPKTSPEQLKAYAQGVGLDLPIFEQYVSSGIS
jgi:hypothetical protein